MYVKKKLAFLADTEAKALITPHPPTPPAVSGRSGCMQFFFFIDTYMFLRQEKPEMDDFERKKLHIFHKDLLF